MSWTVLSRYVPVALALAAACTPQPPAETPAPASVVVPVQTPPAATTVSQVEEVAPATQGWFAPSPLTPFADELVLLNEAARAGRPLPAHRVDIEPSPDENPVVEYRDEDERPAGDMLYIGFGVEADLVFDASGTDGGALRVVLLLTREGWRIARITARPTSSTPATPQWLKGVEDVAWEVVRAARERRLASLLLSESDRAALGNDALFEAIERDLPDAKRLEELSALVPDTGMTGIRVDDIVLIARDGAGEIWGFEFDVDRRDGKLMLDSRPFVRASRFKPPPP